MRQFLTCAVASILAASCSPQAPDVPAASSATIVGYSRIGERAGLLFKRSDGSFTHCFLAQDQLTHCTNPNIAQGDVVGYTATGADGGRHIGDEAAVLVRGAGDSLTQCLVAENGASTCSDMPNAQGQVVGYTYFTDSSAILLQDERGELTECWIEGDHLSSCAATSSTPGEAIGFSVASMEEATVLFLTAEGALSHCILSGGELSDCTNFRAPAGSETIGYSWYGPSPSMLFQHADGSVEQCFYSDGQLSNCSRVPLP